MAIFCFINSCGILSLQNIFQRYPQLLTFIPYLFTYSRLSLTLTLTLTLSFGINTETIDSQNLENVYLTDIKT